MHLTVGNLIQELSAQPLAAEIPNAPVTRVKYTETRHCFIDIPTDEIPEGRDAAEFAWEWMDATGNHLSYYEFDEDDYNFEVLGNTIDLDAVVTRLRARGLVGSTYNFVSSQRWDVPEHGWIVAKIEFHNDASQLSLRYDGAGKDADNAFELLLTNPTVDSVVSVLTGLLTNIVSPTKES